MDTRPERATLNWTRSANSHTGRRHITAASEAGHMSPDHAPCSYKRFFLHWRGRPHMSKRTVLNTAPHSARRLVRFRGSKWYGLHVACLTSDFEAIALRTIASDRVGHALSNVVVAIEGKNRWYQPNDLRFVNVRRTADDNLVADLASARSGAVEDTTTRTAFAKDYISRNPRPGVLVPDLHEFHRQNPCLMTLIRIESN